mgnify:CR=1 FL=1
MSEELAAMKPIWEPGTASGYHSMTYGWLTSELIIRVTGKTLGTFYQVFSEFYSVSGSPRCIATYCYLKRKKTL